MKRSRIIILALLLSIAIMVVLVTRDVITSNYLANKGKSDLNDANAKIALIDSGANLKDVNYDKSVKISKYNVLNDSENITDNNKRGTIIFSALYNDKYSMNKKNDVLIIKAFESGNEIDANNVAKALNYACDNKVDVINLSFGLPDNENVKSAVESCEFKGATIIAMNDDKNSITFPASIKGVVSVSLTNDAVKTDVKVDSSQQEVCIKNKCHRNKNIALSTAYVTGYLIDYKNKEEVIKNLILKPSYSIDAEKNDEEKN